MYGGSAGAVVMNTAMTAGRWAGRGRGKGWGGGVLVEAKGSLERVDVGGGSGSGVVKGASIWSIVLLWLCSSSSMRPMCWSQIRWKMAGSLLTLVSARRTTRSMIAL